MRALPLILIALVMVACGGAPEPIARTDNVLRLNIQGDPVSLDPRVGVERRSQVITNMLFEGLTRVSSDGEPVLGLAESTDISDDGTIYTFHLRPSTWTTGEPVTAYDFEHGWKRAISSEFGTPFAWLFQLISGAREANLGNASLDTVGIHAIDANTLVVQLDHPAPYFLDLIAIPAFAPIPTHLDSENNDWTKSPTTFVSNGPFELVTWKHDSEIVLKKNSRYWDAEAVQLNGIYLSILDDARSVLALFERGEIDWVGEPLSELPRDAVRQLQARGKLEAAPVHGVYFYDFNTQAAPFNSLAVRKAFAAAIDRQAIIDNILTGQETAAGSVLPPGLSLHDGPLLESMSKEEARALFDRGLAELGLDRKHLKPVVLTYAMIEGQRQLALAVQQQWQEVLGVHVTLESLEWKAYLEKILSRDFQICGVTWFSWLPDPIYNLERHKYLTDRFNTMQWADERYIALLDASDQEVDRGRRLSQLQMAEEIVMEGLPCAPVFVPSYYFVRAPNIEGVMINRLGQVDFKYCTIN